jgi:hypothetical protein
MILDATTREHYHCVSCQDPEFRSDFRRSHALGLEHTVQCTEPLVYLGTFLVLIVRQNYVVRRAIASRPADKERSRSVACSHLRSAFIQRGGQDVLRAPRRPSSSVSARKSPGPGDAISAARRADHLPRQSHCFHWIFPAAGNRPDEEHVNGR